MYYIIIDLTLCRPTLIFINNIIKCSNGTARTVMYIKGSNERLRICKIVLKSVFLSI